MNTIEIDLLGVRDYFVVPYQWKMVSNVFEIERE